MAEHDALKSLHTTLIDAEKGYVTAIADAQEPQMKAIFERLAALHAHAHGDVHAILRGLGEQPDENGSFMALVHKTVISVRSAVAGLDRSALPSFIDGEQRIVSAYDEAIAAAPGADYVRTLESDRRALLGAIDEMKAKAA